MRSSASLLLMLATGGGTYQPATGRPQMPDAPAPRAPLPPEAPPLADGPSGTAGTGVQAYDKVGLATWYGDLEGEATTASGAAFDPDAIAAAHRTLPLGSIAEVTALDTGRTILVRITDRGPGDPRYEIDLTRGAANLLGTSDGATPVRVRAVSASAADAAALARGEAASPRMDAPPALLAALRRMLPASAGAPRPAAKLAATPLRPTARPVRPSGPGTSYPPPARPAPPRVAPTPPPSATVTGRYVVQIAAFSTQGRAAALARSLGGSIQPAGALWRVRLGPFGDLAGAQRARDGAVRRGYGDAQIIPTS